MSDRVKSLASVTKVVEDIYITCHFECQDMSTIYVALYSFHVLNGRNNECVVYYLFVSEAVLTKMCHSKTFK